MAIDASHVYLLARIDVVDVRDLLSAHECDGSRVLVTSDWCLSREVPGAVEAGQYADVASRFATYGDASWQSLDDPFPPLGLCYEEGDRRLTAAADRAARATGLPVDVVTNDEDFLINLEHAVLLGYEVVPLPSIALLIELFECGALRGSDLLAALEAEEAHIRTLNLGDRKVSAKLERINDAAIRLAAMWETA